MDFGKFSDPFLELLFLKRFSKVFVEFSNLRNQM